jgi:hypothetical protein
MLKDLGALSLIIEKNVIMDCEALLLNLGRF